MDILISKRNNYDIDGLLKLLFDSLNGLAYIDDKQIVDLRVRKHLNESEDKLIIKIEEVQNKMNINDEIILLITKTPKDQFKKKEINLSSFNPNIKIFKKNDAFIEINISDFINKCKKYLIEVLDYGITSVEDKDNIKLFISKACLIVPDFSFLKS